MRQSINFSVLIICQISISPKIMFDSLKALFIYIINAYVHDKYSWQFLNINSALLNVFRCFTDIVSCVFRLIYVRISLNKLFLDILINFRYLKILFIFNKWQNNKKCSLLIQLFSVWKTFYIPLRDKNNLYCFSSFQMDLNNFLIYFIIKD